MNKRHKIRFRSECDLTVYPPQGRGKAASHTVKVKRGDLMHVHLKPYVVDWVEVCDLFLQDGSEAVAVPYAKFQFV